MLQIKNLSLAILAGVISTSTMVAQSKMGAYGSQAHFQMSENVKPGDYLEKTIIVKVKPEYSSICSSGNIANPIFNQLFAELGGMSLEKVFPHVKAPEKMINERGEKLVDLTLIYQFKSTSFSPLSLIIFSGAFTCGKTFSKLIPPNSANN